MSGIDLDDLRKQIQQLWEQKADKKDLELLQSEMKQKLKALEDMIKELKQEQIKQ